MMAPYTVENGKFKPGRPTAWSTRMLAGTPGMTTAPFDITPDGKRVIAAVYTEDPKPVRDLDVLVNVVAEAARREASAR